MQLSWEEVKKEMVSEKGLDASVADKIGEFVKQSGGMELVESLLSEGALGSNKNAKAGLEDMKLLLHYVELFGVKDKVNTVEKLST